MMSENFNLSFDNGTLKYKDAKGNEYEFGSGESGGLTNIVDAENGGIIEGMVEHNIASGRYSHAEGGALEYDEVEDEDVPAPTTASGKASHAEGEGTIASGDRSHAEGRETVSRGDCAHSEGKNTKADGSTSHAEGFKTQAKGLCSHTEGNATIAACGYQHVFGFCNEPDPLASSAPMSKGTYIEIVGNGPSEYERSNARTLDWSGNESLAGGLTLGKGTTDETTVTAAQLKALIALLNT